MAKNPTFKTNGMGRVYQNGKRTNDEDILNIQRLAKNHSDPAVICSITGRSMRTVKKWISTSINEKMKLGRPKTKHIGEIAKIIRDIIEKDNTKILREIQSELKEKNDVKISISEISHILDEENITGKRCGQEHISRNSKRVKEGNNLENGYKMLI